MTASAEELGKLPVVGGFRERGLNMTRIETFTDAAFAFSLTLLVISFDKLPASFDELLQALKNIPAFAASFAQISLFWYAHHRWSRRYGLDDLATVLLSLTLVFLTLIYVFPLRIVFSSLFSWITNGWLPFELGQIEVNQLGWIFTIYGSGFVGLSLVIVLLYRHSLKLSESLQLNTAERFTTEAEMQAWLLVTVVGLVSVLFSLFAPANYKPMAGTVYASLAIVMPVFGAIKSKQSRSLEGV